MKSMTMLVMTMPFLLMGSGPLTGTDIQLKSPVKIRVEEIPTVASSPKVLGSKNRLMSSPGTVLDSTYYDWQANGGFDDHLAIFDDHGTVRIHAVWTTAYREDLTDRCQSAYNCWSGYSREDDRELSCIFPPPSGQGSLSTLTGGSLVVCSNAQVDSLGGIVVAVDAFPCINAFSYNWVPSEPPGIWPRITVNTDNSMVLTGINPEVYNGVSYGVMWTHDLDTWHHFSDIAPDWMHDDMEPPTIHSGTNGKVGVVIPDFAGSIRLFESIDYGETFDVVTIAEADTADLPSGLDSTAARLGWINSDILYIGDEPHVVWSAGQGVRYNGDYGLLDFKATIFHWSSSTGIDTVVVANTQSADSTRADYVPTPFNHLSVDWPSIGIQSDGHYITVVFTYLNPNDIDDTAIPPTGYLDIWGAESFDNGNSWTVPEPITNPDGTRLGWDDRYPSVAKQSLDNAADPGHETYMIFQSDDLAGTFVQGTEAHANMDYVKFLGFDLGGDGIGDDGDYAANFPRIAILSQNYPNPFNPTTTIDYCIAERSRVILRVFDVRGRLVRTLIDDGKDPGHYSIQWDGRAASGLFVPSGVYLCRMETAGEVNSSRKMLLLK